MGGGWALIPALGLVVYVHLVRVALAATLKTIPLTIGAGCAFSDYAALEPTTPGDRDAPYFRMLYDAGLGDGVYVLHLSHVNLPRDDYISFRPKDADVTSPHGQILAGRNSSGSFYSNSIKGDGFVIELYKTAANATVAATSAPTQTGSTAGECFGFEVDELRFTPADEAKDVMLGEEAAKLSHDGKSADRSDSDDEEGAVSNFDESICGSDESLEAKCVEASGSAMAMYDASRAVGRLVIRKDNINIAFCTGFLLGCEGHLITNEHCIGTWLDALNTAVEFYAEATQCGAETCESRAACPGSIRVSSTALVAVSKELDYALVKLSPDDGLPVESLLAQVGGYLQLRASGPVLDETIYIPQYPQGWGKRIASTVNGKPGRIESLTVDTCGGDDAGYYVDTQEGSSGAPIIATSDNSVIALHHCGGCLNGAIQSQRLIADLQLKGVLPRCATS